MFPRPGDALAGDARHGEASQKSLSAFHRPQYKFRVLLPLRLTEARKTPGVWRDFFVGSLLSVENPIISGPKQALSVPMNYILVKTNDFKIHNLQFLK